MVKNFKNTPPNNAVLELINLIKLELANFPKSDELQDVTALHNNENTISEALCLYLLDKAKKSEFKFINESAQSGTHKVDFAIYYGTTLIFTIEAKLLPTPLAGGREEHEYTHNSKMSGGVQRFKMLKHGLDKQGVPLLESGMFAYIKSNGYPYWEREVNQWIDNAGWGSPEHLNKTGKYSKSPLAVLESTHKRTDGTDIKLTHFWIKIPK